MKLKYSFKEDDRRYSSFILTKKELALISEYFNDTFTPENTQFICMYDYNFMLLAVQVVGNKIYELQPEEAIKLFKNKIKECEVPYAEN